MRNITIFGSTGLLGQCVTYAFIKAGYTVTLLVRDTDKAQGLFGSSVNIMKGDLRDTQAINDSLKDAEYVYCNLSVEPDSTESDFQAERDGLQKILSMAKNMNIKRIGYMSSLVHRHPDMHWWVFEIKKNAVQTIKNSGVNYTLFYPSTFMENFDKGGYRNGNTINLAGTSLHKMYVIAGDDYAQQVVKAFEIDTANAEYYPQGLEGFNAEEIASMFVMYYTKHQLKIARVPLFLLQCIGLFSRKMKYASNIIHALNTYPEIFEAEHTWNALGKPEITLKEYILKS